MKLWKVLARNSHVYKERQCASMELYEHKSRSSTFSDDSGQHSSSLQDPPEGLLLTSVQLRKKSGESLGIVLQGGAGSCGAPDPEMCPSIAALRPGSAALASDQLAPGDRICSVNGINTTRMRPEEVASLLDHVDGHALLEIQYSLPAHCESQSALCLAPRVADVTLDRADGSLGITLRGGAVPERPQLSRPLVVTQVRPHGPAHRSGLIHTGDRLLKVNGHSLIGKTLLEAQQLLRDDASPAALTIEYDVGLMEAVRYASGPLLVEVDRRADEPFGLVLGGRCELQDEEALAVGFFVEHVVPASTADRCGALHAGDKVLAIDDVALDTWGGSPAEAEALLRTATRLQILPAHAVQRANLRSFGPFSASPSTLGFNTIASRRSHRNNNNRKSIYQMGDCVSGSNYCGFAGNIGVCHAENLNVTLAADRSLGYGLTVSVGERLENKAADILISRIAPNSPAYRCGCLQIGDRVVSVNHQSNLTLQEINAILGPPSDFSNCKINLEVEFDVADTIVPSSGIFTVKLAKKGPGLGITITASKTSPDEPFIISDIKRGSIAHRTGTLHAGDRLLAIDNRPLDHLSLESAFEVLQTSANDIVTLKVEKSEVDNANLALDSIVYTVELQRRGGPLGITISGSEDCLDPIVLTRLTEGGLAEKTGALHVGDRILAINGEHLERRPLSDAIRLLQSSGDRVQLKIARNLPSAPGAAGLASGRVLSVDSAVHSWDSAHADNAASPPAPPEDEEEGGALSDALSYQELMLKKHDSQIQYYSDAEDAFCPSPLPLPNYRSASPKNFGFVNRLHGTCSNESILDNEIYHVTLYKDSIYDDYGFSVSDGLYEKGVYINRIRKGGPADIVGLLKPFDRIIQVNDTKTKDFDCCLTVPLIASAGDRIELIISRNPYINYSDREFQDHMSKKSFSPTQNMVTKTL